MKRNLYEDLKDFLFPRACVVCGRRLSTGEEHVCFSCLNGLPRTHYHAQQTNPMEQCFWGRLPVERATTLFFYRHESDFRKILWELKYNNRPEIGALMGRVLAREIMPTGFFEGIDLLVPIPLARPRLRQRGYNQCEWIAKGIGQATQILVCSEAVRRAVANVTQTRKHRMERAENVQGVFELANGDLLKNKHILLIDDVMTTGATLISCGSELTDIEGVRISVLTLAMAAR